jgi:thiol-disulfide isomerase/thioredoxin
MKRRTLAMGAAAAAAGLVGVGTAWWQRRPDAAAPQPAVARARVVPAGDVGTQGGDVVEAFWKSSFDTPDGTPLPMNGFRGKPLLVNFWATWCPPCIEELPLLNSFHRLNKHKGWQVLGLAVDQPSAVRQWLQAKPLDFPVGMAGFGGTELSKSFGNLSGGLPFSVVLAASGQLLHRKTGKISLDELALWAQLK